MSGRRGTRHSLLLLPLLLLTATTARAGQTSYYQVTGPVGAAIWGLGDEPGTQALAFAFTRVTPVKPQATTAAVPTQDAPVELPPPSARLAFTVTRWSFEDDQWVRRQWFGDMALDDRSLSVASTLVDGKLDAIVLGTLEEMTEDDVIVRENVRGRIKVNWTAYGRLANSTLSYNYQTPSFATTLQMAGQGRSSRTTATVTVDGMGDPIALWGFGTLAAVKAGVLSVTQQ
jgi:hypothetical protein